jgi:hypothetical protein
MVEEIIAKQIGWFHEAVTRARWFEWLRRELAPTPGRWETTVRLVVTIALVPEVALSATEGVHQAVSGRVESLFAGDDPGGQGVIGERYCRIVARWRRARLRSGPIRRGCAGWGS